MREHIKRHICYVVATNRLGSGSLSKPVNGRMTVGLFCKTSPTTTRGGEDNTFGTLQELYTSK
jgi:hypothetical protein